MPFDSFEIISMGSSIRTMTPEFARHHVRIKLKNPELGANNVLDFDIALPYEGIEMVDKLERRILAEVRRLLAEATVEIEGKTIVQLYAKTDENARLPPWTGDSS